jgi:hypothetical protein
MWFGRLEQMPPIQRSAEAYHARGFVAYALGYLAGLRDPFVDKALSLLHARPDDVWTIDVDLSRSVLAERIRRSRRHSANALPHQNCGRRSQQDCSTAAIIATVAAEIG